MSNKTAATGKKFLVFTIEYEIEVEPSMTVSLDEAIDALDSYGHATIVDAKVITK